MSEIKASLIIVALNEIEGLKVTIAGINSQKKYLHEIIYVDGGSVDGSIEFSKRQKEWKIIVQGEGNKGALNGLKIGVENSTGSHIIFFSPDNNCIPEKIEEIVKNFKAGYDFVKVSRYYKGSKSYDDTIITGFGNFLFSFIVRLIYGAKCTDALNIYYGLKKSLFYDLKINFKNTAINTEVTIKVHVNKVKYTDIGGDEPMRAGGVSKRPIIYHGIMELFTIIKFIGLLFKNKKN